MYFHNISCTNCESKVTIENKCHFVITKGKGVGIFNAFKVSACESYLNLRNLLVMNANTKGKRLAGQKII